MTNKIAIVLVAILVTAITVPTAYAALNPTDERFDQVCYNKETDGKLTFADFSCAVNIYQMFHDINGLLFQVDTMDDTLNGVEHKTDILNQRVNSLQHADDKFQNTITKIKDNIKSSNAEIDDIESRLLVLEGKVMPPTVPLTMHVMPDVISKDETFVVYGTANRVEQDWVDFAVYDPNGIQVQWFVIETLQNGGYFPSPITPSHKWITNGTYTITATHGEHEIVNATINYIMAETP